MNKQNRKDLIKMSEKIYDLVSQIDNLREELADLATEEESKYDNLNEGLQESEMGQRLQEGYETLQDLADRLEYAVSDIYAITEEIESATEL